jgi:hypothetical protein
MQMTPAGEPTVVNEVVKAKQQAEVEAILAALNSTRWKRKQAAALPVFKHDKVKPLFLTTFKVWAIAPMTTTARQPRFLKDIRTGV